MIWWGRHHRIWLSNRFASSHAAYIEKAALRFEKAGRWFPPQLRRDESCPAGWQEYPVDEERMSALAARYTRERVAGDPYTFEEILDAVSRAFDALGPGERLTADKYRQLGTRIELPSVKTVYQVAKRSDTTFGAMVRDEAARRASAMRAAASTTG